MAFLQTVLHGEYLGQDVINVLWSRSAFAPLDSTELIGGLDAYNAEIKQNFWDSRSPAFIAGYGMRDLMSDNYTLVEIVTTAYAEDFNLISSDPVTLGVNEAGLVATEYNGSTNCVILKANLEPVFGPGIGLPSRGYLAFGPLADAMVLDDGNLASSWLPLWQGFADRLASNITTEAPPNLFFPIRVRVTRVLGVVVTITYKDISDFVVRSLTSYRKSRQPEA